MAFGFDKALGVHEHAIAIQTRRIGLLASNIANADTPNYKARDLDFREALRRADRAVGTVRTTHARHLEGATAYAGGEPGYRVPLQPSLDGNTVEAQVEQAAFADNAVRFQASLRFIDGRIKGLRHAITGGR